jgi:hypothetical protein
MRHIVSCAVASARLLTNFERSKWRETGLESRLLATGQAYFPFHELWKALVALPIQDTRRPAKNLPRHRRQLHLILPLILPLLRDFEVMRGVQQQQLLLPHPPATIPQLICT